MSKIYETRLKKEFELLQRLQRHPFNKNKVVQLYYKDRMGGAYKSILDPINGPLYPNQFRVTYTMPMYVDEGQIKNDWSATFLFEVPEEILMDPDSKLGVEIEGNNGNFPEGAVPFNNHVSTGWVCTGSAWGVANQGFGIWYFIISLGCLLNQEKFMMASDPSDENKHLNADAFRYWKNVRKMQPNNKIDWPFKLNETIFEPGRVTPAKPETPKSKFFFGAKTTEPETPKSKFFFGAKTTEPVKKSTFTFGHKSEE